MLCFCRVRVAGLLVFCVVFFCGVCVARLLVFCVVFFVGSVLLVF